MNKSFQKSANAMLVSIILSSVLMLVALTANSVIMRQVRAQYNAVQATQSYYSAQGGIEEAFLNVNQGLPGFEFSLSSDADQDSNQDYAVEIDAKNQALPCDQDSASGWYSIKLGESFRLPLFVGDGEDEQVDVEDFVVEYYVYKNIEGAEFVKTEGDILKWSVMGMKKSATDGYISESIQDYLPLQDSKVDAEDPSSFGTFGESFETANYYTEDFENTDGTSNYIFYENYPIDTFLTEHESNYLVLQNIIELSKQNSICDDSECNQIRFRIKTKSEDQQLACSVILVKADGFSANTKQSIDVRYTTSSFLPVFDFALFNYSKEE